MQAVPRLGGARHGKDCARRARGWNAERARLRPTRERPQPAVSAGGVVTGMPAVEPEPWSRYSLGALPVPVKSNRPMMLPELASKEPAPMRVPPSQLSSMKRTTEVWSISVWST